MDFYTRKKANAMQIPIKGSGVHFFFFFESANVSPLLGFFVIVSHGYLPANLLLTYKIS